MSCFVSVFSALRIAVICTGACFVARSGGIVLIAPCTAKCYKARTFFKQNMYKRIIPQKKWIEQVFPSQDFTLCQRENISHLLCPSLVYPVSLSCCSFWCCVFAKPTTFCVLCLSNARCVLLEVGWKVCRPSHLHTGIHLWHATTAHTCCTGAKKSAQIVHVHITVVLQMNKDRQRERHTQRQRERFYLQSWDIFKWGRLSFLLSVSVKG